MNEKKLFLSGVCPYCPAVLDYAEDSRAVTCHSCGNVVPTRILRPLDFAKSEHAETEVDRRIADGVTSSSAGIIYFDNFCDSYDWREFALHTNLSISTLDSIAEACKIKFAADPITYYLDFRCIAIPVLKKIEGLDVLEVEIIDNYKSDDLSDLFEYVDRYSAITRAITEKREALTKALSKDITLAEKFGAPAHILKDLKRSYEVFEEKVNNVVCAENIEDIPGYKKAKDLKDAQLAAKIRRIGIDAEKTYVKALELLEKGNVDNALHLFAAIHGYKDSSKHVDDNSMIFKFNDELVEMAGKFYLVKRNSGAVFEPSNPQPISEGTMSLYEIVHATPSATPSLTMFTDVLRSFGTKIFFLRNNVSICCYDTASKDYNANVKILDEAPSGDYVIRHKHAIYDSSDKTKFFVRKKLREEVTTKRGCFGKKKIKKKPAQNRKNNYSIVLVDMDNVTSKVILPEVVDVMDYDNDKIFYTTFERESIYPSFRVYDIETEKVTQILNSNCIIHKVSGKNIIYSLRVPSINNKNLYSVNIETCEHRLIDSNVSDFYTMHGNRVFYKIGGRDDVRLYSANVDGSDIREIMEKPGDNIKFLSSGWLYYVSGEGVNACLMKVSTDGSKNMLVASKFKEFIKMLNGYIYYIATNGDLKAVRSDGRCDTRIAPKIFATKNIIIDKEKVYYLKQDYFDGAGTSNAPLYSLYSTDLQGKNMRKISHDVTAMSEYNDRYIYLCKRRTAKYSVVTPRSNKDSTTEVMEKNLVYYESYDKQTGEFTDIVRLGEPKSTTVTYKKSRLPFSKYVVDRNVITEIENEYVRSDVAPAGLIEKEELKAIEKEQRRVEDEKRAARDKKEARKAEKRAKKKAKKDAKRAKKNAKRDKKAEKKNAKKQAAQAEHERMSDEIDGFLAAQQELNDERQAQLNASQAKLDSEEAEREAANAKREEQELAGLDEQNEKKLSKQKQREDDFARSTAEFEKLEEEKQNKKNAKADKKSKKSKKSEDLE